MYPVRRHAILAYFLLPCVSLQGEIRYGMCELKAEHARAGAVEGRFLQLLLV